MLSEIVQLEEIHMVFLGSVAGAILLFAASVVLGIAAQIRKLRQHRHDLAFKSSALQRGLSISDIERLMAATKPGIAARGSQTIADFLARIIDSVRQLLTRPILAFQWSRVRRVELELKFKRELLQQGHSVEQIEQLLNAGPKGFAERLREDADRSAARVRSYWAQWRKTTS